MYPQFQDAALENWHDFEIESRKEIVSLLRNIGQKNQLIRMLIQGESDVCVTSILAVDDVRDTVVLDTSIDAEQNKRIANDERLSFETTLDKVRIMFAAERIEAITHEGEPAFRISVPPTLIRLQRREFYRMNTPVTNPVRVVIPLPEELGGNTSFPLADISCGGIAILDNKMLLGDAIGKVFPGCRIDLPEIGAVTTSLQVRNSLDMTLLNNKTNRRLGCEFTDIQRSMLAYVQRYITKLERERNARIAGMS